MFASALGLPQATVCVVWSVVASCVKPFEDFAGLEPAFFTDPHRTPEPQTLDTKPAVTSPATKILPQASHPRSRMVY